MGGSALGVASEGVASSTGSNAYMIYIPVGVFFVLCPLIVGIRLWARRRTSGRLDIDDFFILAALTFSLASGVVMIISCHYGYGQHWKSLSPFQRREAMKFFYLCQITYKFSINLTKASILLLYMRIFGNVRWFKLVCAIVLGSVAVYCVASVTATIFQCTPIAKAFDKTIEGYCIDNGRFWYANAGFSIATDLIILILPMPLVRELRIPPAQKAGLMGIFALGIFVVITSCLRVTTIKAQATTNDKTHEIDSTMWTIIEMNVAIICACLPQVRTLLARIFPELLQSQTYRISRNRKRAHGGSTDGAKILAPGEESARTRASSNEDVIINLTESQSTVPRTSEHRLDYDGLYV